MRVSVPRAGMIRSYAASGSPTPNTNPPINNSNNLPNVSQGPTLEKTEGPHECVRSRASLWREGGTVVGVATGVYAGAAHGLTASVAGITLGAMVGGAAGSVIGGLLDRATGNDDPNLPRYLAAGLAIAGGVAGAVGANYTEGPVTAVVLGVAGAISGGYLALRADAYYDALFPPREPGPPALNAPKPPVQSSPAPDAPKLDGQGPQAEE